MKEINLRSAAKEDAEEVGKVLFKSSLAKSTDNGKELFLKELKRGDRYIIAEKEDIALGVVSWIFHGEYRHGLAELYHIGVVPEAKGTGVAVKLFEALKEEIDHHYKKEGHRFRKLYLLTHDDNHVAHSFYKKVGMTHETTLKHHFHHGKHELVFSYFP